MSFRLSKRIKILPGLTLNLSGGGISASVGVRGARVTFGQRGTYGNVGIPGTGVSYRTRLDGPARKLSDREIGASHRRYQARLAHATAVKSVEAEAEAHRQLLDSWKNLPIIPTLEEFRVACFERDFHFQEPPPQPPDLETVADNLRQRLLLESECASRRNIYRGLTLGAGCLVMVGMWKMKLTWLVIVVAIAICGIMLWLERYVSKQVQIRAEAILQQRWPDECSRINGMHGVLCEEFESRRSAAEATWKASELSRAEWARRLFYGDLSALGETFNATFSEIPFPFDTSCDAYFNDATKVYLKLDLPEIEDVVETSLKKVLRDGRIKEVKRRAVEVNLEYARLACGLGILTACEAFTCGPTIQTVEVAAFTQRIKRPGLPPEDCYIYNFEMSRGEAITDQLQACEPVAQIHALGGTIDPDKTGRLKTIQIPWWCIAAP